MRKRGEARGSKLQRRVETDRNGRTGRMDGADTDTDAWRGLLRDLPAMGLTVPHCAPGTAPPIRDPWPHTQPCLDRAGASGGSTAEPSREPPVLGGLSAPGRSPHYYPKSEEERTRRGPHTGVGDGQAG